MSLFDNVHNSSIQEAINGNQNSSLYGAIVTEIEENKTIDDSILDYYFDVITDESIELINQITDNYVENNTAIQDHIAQNPLVITVSGLSGEKVFKYDPGVANQLLAEARIQAAKYGNMKSTAFWTLIGAGAKAEGLNKLSVIPSLYPPVSNYMQVAMNAAELADAAVTKYRNIYQSLKDSGSPEFENVFSSGDVDNTRIKQIYNKFVELLESKKPLSITTAYGFFTNMYIQSVRLSQGNELYKTDIQLTLKQLRFSNVTTTAADKNVMAKYNAYARAEVENNGIAQGKQTNISILYNMHHNK